VRTTLIERSGETQPEQPQVLIPEVRQETRRRRLWIARAITILVVAAVAMLLVARLVGGGARETPTKSGSLSAATATAGGLGRVDPSCNAGKGFSEPVTRGALGNLLYTETTSDVTVVGFDTTTVNNLTPLAPYVLYAITPGCNLDRSFGTNGFLTPGIPAQGLSSLAPGLGGRFFLLATDPRGFWISERNASGTIDNGFGSHGWISIVSPVLKLAGWGPISDTLIQEPSGTIVVTGEVLNNEYEYGLEQSYIYELHPNGQPIRRFGDDGRVIFDPPAAGGFPTDSDADTVIQPNGAIAVIGSFGWFNDIGGKGFGGPGCSHTSIEWLSSSGAPERAVDSNYVAQNSIVRTAGFVGSEFIDPSGGVGLIGEARPCTGDAQVGKPFSVVEALTPSGLLDQRFGDRGELRFSIPDETNSDGFATAPLPDGHIVQGSETSQYFLQDFTANGRLLKGFGRSGLLEVDSVGGPVNLVPGARGDFVVVVAVSRAILMTERRG
jgi:hypothetical protein